MILAEKPAIELRDKDVIEKIPMTAEGYDALENELKQRKSVERPSIVRAIAEARAHGDLSENAEYHAAKEAQGMNEARVLELEEKNRLGGGHRYFQAQWRPCDVWRDGNACR